MARAPSFDGYRTVPDVHQELINLLSCEYLVEGNGGARKFCIRSWKYLNTPKDKQKEKVEDVLEALRAKGKFTEGNYEVLKELTKEIDDDIDQLITEAEEKIENIKNETTSSTKKKEKDRELQVRIDVQSDMQKKGKAVVLAVFQWTIQNSNKSHIPKLLHCSEFETIITDLYIICCESYTKDHLSDYGRKIFSNCIEAAEKSFKAGKKQFLQFKKHQLPELKRFITTSGENWRKTFSAFDAEASSVLCRCVYLYLKFDSVIGLERFWHYYTSCQFVKDLNDCFNSSIVLKLLNVDRLDVTACISDIEYRNLHEYLGPRTISPNIRASADSRIPSDEEKRKRNFTDQMIPPGPEESIEEKISGMPDEKDQEHYIETRDYLDCNPQPSTRSTLLVAAIDLGVTFSGYAFSFKHEYESDPLKIHLNTPWRSGSRNLVTWNTPTSLLLDSDMKFLAFGYEAEDIYNMLVDNEENSDHRFFTRFKMILFNQQNIKKDVMIKDTNGRPCLALSVFSHSICYLKNHLIERLEGQGNCPLNPDQDIQWVLTVPAIWNDSAKQFMREAAKKADLSDNTLILVPESTAALELLRHLPAIGDIGPFKIGDRYMVLDLGGGTVDVTVHEIRGGHTSAVIYTASSRETIGATMDETYIMILREIFGSEIIEEFVKKQGTDLLDLQREIEMIKRMADKSFISLPMVLLDIYADMTGKDLNQSVAESKYHDTVRIIGEKVKFNKELAKNVFEEAKRGIVDFVKDCLYKKNIDMKITSIIIVGGFASSNRIVEAVREACPNHRVVVPLEPDIAVLKGATIYGHVPRIIMSRISRYTYGIGVLNTFIQGQHPEDKRVKKNGTDLCKDVFEKFVEAGRKVPSEGLDREYDITFAHKPLELQMFVTSDQRPVLTSDTGCLLLGKICVELPTGGWKTDATVSVRIYFGGTEIHVMARDSQKDFLYEANYDFL